MDTIAWLLDSDSDPAIRFQAMRDLTGASPAALAAERARIPRQGVAAEILARQGSGGAWHRPGSPDWLPTLFTMQLLRATGVDPTERAVERAVASLATGFRWAEEFDAKPFFEGEVEPCINGGVLALGGYFGRPSKSLARRLLGDQLMDGGWNCEAPKSASSSFHTTICVLEGLLEYERAVGSAPEIAAARRRGEGYLLERRLFKRRSTGEVANPAFLDIAFPPRYHYDILRALDYFRAAGAPPDPRVSEAVRLVQGKRQIDGRWLLDRAYEEALAFSCGESVGQPSRWNTLRAQRVQRWYERPRNAFVELPDSAGERWTCFFAEAAPYPPAPSEVVLLSYGGKTAEQGLERLRYGASRHVAFSLERTRVLAGPWPEAEPKSAPAYQIRPGRFVAVVPSIDPRWSPKAPEDAPVGRIAGSGATEDEASASAIALGVRAFVGRVESMVYCETGGEIGGAEKGPAGLVFGW